MNINNEIIRLKKEINELKSRNIHIGSKIYRSTTTTNDIQSINKTNMLNFLSSLNELNNNNMSSDKKNKKKLNNNLKILINPPFKKGIFSYKSSFNNSPKNMILKTNKSSKFISSSLLDSNSNSNMENNIYNSSINLNKYKIKIRKNTETNSNNYEKYYTENPDLKNIKMTTSKNLTKENKNYIILENDIFNDKKLYEKESRRMMIEYTKVLKKTEKKDLNLIIKMNHFSEKILNQKKIYNEIQQSYNLIHKNNSTTFISYSGAESIFNSMKDIKNPYLTSYQSFIKKMTDDKIDKIKMLKFLSIPRKFKLNYKGKIFNFLFILRPNKLTFLNGIESYIFQWMDLNSQSYVGGFDLIKINSCYIKNNDTNIFIIETLDSNIKKLYEIDTNSFSTTSYYVTGLNYLSQLEKCKIYNNNIYN